MMVEEEVVVGEEEVTERRRGRCDDRCLEGSQVSASPGHTPKGRHRAALRIFWCRTENLLVPFRRTGCRAGRNWATLRETGARGWCTCRAVTARTKNLLVPFRRTGRRAGR